MSYKDIYRDQALFSRIAEGDGEALSLLFQLYSDPLYRNAYKLVKSEFWAEEIVQVVFTQLWLNRSGLKEVVSPSAYLYRMVTNKARDRMRKQEREMKMQYWLEQQASASAGERAATIVWEELHALLEKAVNALPSQRKRVYQLKYQEGLSYEEIAGELSLSRNTVRNHMANALEDIRAFLLRHAGFILFLVWLQFF